MPDISDTRDVCDRLAAFCLRLAPEIGRLYVVAADGLPAGLRPLATTAGYTGPTLDLHLRPCLGQRWTGRGPAMVLHLAAIADEAVGMAGDFAADFADLCRRFAAHELAHIVSRPFPFYGPEPADLAAELATVELSAGRTAAEDFPPDFPRWVGHGPRFIRAAIHLQHRAAALGQRVAASAICGGRRYGLAHAACYAVALGDEPERLAGLTIAEILETEPPADFLAVWADDYKHWLGAGAKPLEEEKPPMSAILDKIQGELDAREQEKAEAFRRLVASIADGCEPAAGDVADILREADKTAADLRQAAETLHKRRELRKRLDGLADVEAEEGTLQRQIDTADAKLRRAEEAHAEATDGPRARLRELGRQRADARLAEAELRRTAPADLRERLAEAAARARAAQADAEAADKRQHQALDKANVFEQRAGAHWNFPREWALKEAADARKRGEKHAADAADARKRFAEAQADAAAAERAMLQP